MGREGGRGGGGRERRAGLFANDVVQIVYSICVSCAFR